MRRPALGVAAAALVVLAAPRGVGAQEAPTNLQVLPSDLTRQEVNQIMRGFTAALGVRCSTCHVGEEGQPLSTYDFASDDKPMKVKARAMLLMSREINQRFLAELPSRREPNVAVTCVTCHRGVSRPAPVEDVVRLNVELEGVDYAVEEYRRLRERHYGGFAYDFGERPLLALAEEMAASDAGVARRLLELNVEFHPTSVGTLFALARLHDEAGEAAAAIGYYRRVLEVQPGNQRAQERLRALGGGGG